MTLNEKVVEILKRHPEGGEKFFNALDLMVRGDKDILRDYVRWVQEYYGSECRRDIGVILTGSFGRVMVSLYGLWLQDFFGDVIIVNGGIRSGNPVELPVVNVPLNNYILLDDSYYSGKTMKSIESAIRKLNSKTTLSNAFVVYDGSKERSTKILGMYRYYNK